VIDLADFRRVVFFTGAGLSAASGIPTYRGDGGTWAEYDYREFACEQAFEADPDKVWDFHDERRRFVASRAPNDAHVLIAEIQAKKPDTWIVTQNVDGLHQRAGATDVLELHGSLWRVRCDACRTVRDDMTVPLAERRCACGAPLRPDITWFGDVLDMAVVGAAERTITRCDALVSIGTSGVVFPAAQLPQLAAMSGATLVEINPEETPVSLWYEHHLRGPAIEMLQTIWRAS
jgi:NAD-dependent deacetylase